jgi:hypothetical protein
MFGLARCRSFRAAFHASFSVPFDLGRFTPHPDEFTCLINAASIGT